MSRAIYISILFCFFCRFDGFSQHNDASIRITYTCNQLPLEQVLSELQKQYNLRFSYSNSKIDLSKKITLQAVNQSLDVFLNDLLPGNIQYRILHHQVILLPKAINEQHFTLSGFLIDNASAESLIGATIFQPSGQSGAISNASGFFSIRLQGGKQTLQVHSLGYKSDTLQIYLATDTLVTIRLEQQSYKLETVKVYRRNTDWHQDLRLMRLTNKTIDMEMLKTMPSLLGENDVMRLLSTQPGIISNEINSDNMNVRGGSSDQTMYLLDEMAMFDVAHFGGFFSVFNPDVVKHVTIHKNDIPPWSGEALSSVVDVRLREGNKDEWDFYGGIGSLSVRATADGPVWKDKASLLVAFRRSYIDQFLPLISADGNSKPLEFFFYDFNLKLDARINQKNIITFNSYLGADNIIQFTDLQRQNTLFGLKWNCVLSKNLFLNTSANYSFRYFAQNTNESGYSFLWESDYDTREVKTELSYYIHPKLELHAGYNYAFIQSNPSTIKPNQQGSIVMNNSVPTDNFHQQGFFASARYSPLPALIANASFRLGYSKNTGPKSGEVLVTDSSGYTILREGKKYASGEVIYHAWLPEPQLTLQYTLGGNHTVGAMYSLTRQFIHQLYVYQPGISIKRSLSSSNQLPPEVSHNFALGLYSRPNKHLHYGLEGYTRRMFNLVESDLVQRAVLSQVPESISFKVNGKARGLEFFLKAFGHKMSAEVNYTLSRTERQTARLNEGKPFVTMYDHPHVLTLSTLYKLSRRIQFSALWICQTGSPYSKPVGKYQLDGKTLIHLDNNQINNARLPAYHRLDLSCDIAGRKNQTRNWKGYWNISVYNVYFRKNPLGITYLNVEDDQGNITGLKAHYTYFYLFVPSVSYKFKF